MNRDDRVRMAIAWADGAPEQYATGYVVAINGSGEVTVQWDGGEVETVPPSSLEAAPPSPQEAGA